MRLIYYAHPIETYKTYLEDLIEETVQKHLGETSHIRNRSSLRHAVEKGAHKKFDSLFIKMKDTVKRFRGGKIPESDAFSIAHEFMEALKDNICVNAKNILLNPSTFSGLSVVTESNFIIFEEVGDRFKRMAFPHFCYGLIAHCDAVVAHGYVIDSYIKCVLKGLLKELKKSLSQLEVSEYCGRLLEILDGPRRIIWSPGTFNEIKYALDMRKEVYCLRNKTLRKVSSRSALPANSAVIPFDEYGLRLYNRIWQPIARSVYGALTETLRNF
jgi:hypothetical protein